jgi:rsbT co-antagonist protein RsbR
MASSNSVLDLLEKDSPGIISDWTKLQLTSFSRQGAIKDAEMRAQCERFIALLIAAIKTGDFKDLQSPGWSDVRDNLSSISTSRNQLGFTASETAAFVFSLKRVLFARLKDQAESQGKLENILSVDHLLDTLGLFTTEVYQRAREDIISRQQQDLLELSTPVVKLWDGILALPLVGTLDSSRTQVVMEALLEKIVETGSEVAIIDITGVPTVDTLVAQHLLKTVTAARLMGADCIISGIRPQIAQTIVHLGVNLGDVSTKSNMADAFRLALSRLGKRLEVHASASRP